MISQTCTEYVLTHILTCLPKLVELFKNKYVLQKKKCTPNKRGSFCSHHSMFQLVYVPTLSTQTHGFERQIHIFLSSFHPDKWFLFPTMSLTVTLISWNFWTQHCASFPKLHSCWKISTSEHRAVTITL